MKVSEYIKLLNEFKHFHGDTPIEFWAWENKGEGDSMELKYHTLREIDSRQRKNSGPETICEIVLGDIDQDE